MIDLYESWLLVFDDDNRVIACVDDELPFARWHNGMWVTNFVPASYCSYDLNEAF